MNAPDEVETWWTRCVVIYSSPFESARARVYKKSDSTPRACDLWAKLPSPRLYPCRLPAARLKRDNRDRGLQGFRFAPSADGTSSARVLIAVWRWIPLHPT